MRAERARRMYRLRCRRPRNTFSYSISVKVGLEKASCPQKQGGLARDKLRAECAPSAAPIPEIEPIVQK